MAEFIRTSNTALTNSSVPTVQYVRGRDMGGGVGGLLYSIRGTTLKYNHSNGRGDIVAQSDSTGALSWTASYEAYGKQTKKTGTNIDTQRANSKDEEKDTSLLNEGYRYRDLETGVWLSRDPAGFVDGSNLYAYVKQNPWSKFDAEGLWGEDLFIGVPSIAIGASSLWSNVKKGHWGAAAWDGVGIVLDGAAIATPGVPGGVGMATRAARLAAAKDKVENAIDTVETVVDVGTALATGDPTALVEVIVDEALDKATGSKKKGGESPTSSQRPASKRGPKTDPNAPHNKTIRQEADQLEADGNKILAGGGREKEKLIPTPGGSKGGRRPDILYETPGGQTKGRNVGKVDSRGQPVKREREALDDLNGNGGVPTDFVPYNTPKPDNTKTI